MHFIQKSLTSERIDRIILSNNNFLFSTDNYITFLMDWKEKNSKQLFFHKSYYDKLYTSREQEQMDFSRISDCKPKVSSLVQIYTRYVMHRKQPQYDMIKSR